MTRLQGAVAAVTGASSGIGRSIALALAAHGCHVLVCGRDRGRLEEVAGRTGGEVLVADLADADETAALGEALAAWAPDVVVLNAGSGLSVPADSVRAEDVDRLFAVNALATVRLTRAVLPSMRRRGSGHLVVVSSVAGVLGVPEESTYAASKAAGVALAASLRAELAGDGIDVTTVLPGVVATEFFTRRGAPYRRRFPRPVSAERVAEAVVRDGLQRRRALVVVPAWLRLPMALQAVAPQAYARMAARWS